MLCLSLTHGQLDRNVLVTRLFNRHQILLTVHQILVTEMQLQLRLTDYVCIIYIV